MFKILKRAFKKNKLLPHEIGEVYNLKKFIKEFKIDSIYDVGANNGQYAQMLRKKVNFQGNIFSFEPFSKIYEELKKNAKNDDNWHTFNYAISNTSGIKKLNVAQNDQMNSFQKSSIEETDILKDINTQYEFENVKTKTLSEAIIDISSNANCKNILLKLDTQGHDLTILKSSDNLKFFSGIQCEIAFKSIYLDAPKYYETIQFLEKSGFELSAIFPNNSGHFPYLIEQDILVINKDKINIKKND